MPGNCPDDNQLARYVARQLASSARAKVEEHLDTCSECLHAVALMARDTSLGGTVAERAPPQRDTGTIAGRYRIDAVLGEGGMGTVYLAFDTKLERLVALKVVRGDHLDVEQGHARMEREAKAMAKLAHPNVVTVFDTGTVGDRVYIAMELVEGVTLEEWLTTQPRKLAEIVRTFCSAGEGLVAAHAVGVVHRDFKPQNVLVGRNGRVAVTDFGLAFDAADPRRPTPGSEDSAPHVTRAGAIMGTPHYMSPEQRRAGPVDARSDQFSFALSLEETLAKAPVPARMRRALRRALAEDASNRFPSLEALLAELRPFARDSRWRAAPIAIGLLGVATASAIAFGIMHRRAPGTDAPTTNRTVTLLDLQMPASSVPEALAAYHDGLVEQHDGVRGSYKRFQAAAAKDPLLATAFLRHAVIELSTDDPDRHAASLEAFRHAVDGRDRLSPRDRSVLDALSPALLGQPADWATCEQRLRARSMEAPHDENLVTTLAQVLAIEGKLGESDATYARASALDPQDVGVLALRADEQLLRGDREGAATTASRCIETNPRATSCIGTLFSIRAVEGRCRDTEMLSQRLITARPDDVWGYLDLHESELALGEPDETVVATEEQLIAHSPSSDRFWSRFHYPWLRAILEGEFARANGLIDQELALAVEQGLLADELRALHDIAVTAAEVGDVSRAAHAADRYLKRKKALPLPTYLTRNVIAREHVPTMIAIAARGKLLSSDDARRMRDAWLDEWRTRLAGRESAYLWLQAYATPAETPEEIAAALARLPSDAATLATGDELEAEGLGRLYAKAGRFADAIPLLESASKQCRVRRFPLAIVRASYFLGVAREGTGDCPGACEAYGRVVSRWSRPGPVKSTTAGLAAARSKALGCP